MVDRFVDPSINGSCSNYNPNTRNCLGGSEQAYSTFAAAQVAANAGQDRILLRSGQNYSALTITKNVLQISGYLDEIANVAFAGSGTAFTIADRDGIHFRNLSTTNNNGYCLIDRTDNCIWENCHFSGSRHQGGTSSAFRMQFCNYNTVFNCTFVGNNNTGFDLCIMRHDCNYNRFLNNTYEVAGHTLMPIKCSSFNIVRFCTFNNENNQKCGEMYDCPSDGPGLSNSTHRNLWEYNKFTGTPSSDAPHRFNGMQWCGQRGLMRFNEFYDCDGGAVNIQDYGGSCSNVNANHCFSNTFLENECYGVVTQGTAVRQHRGMNNLLVRNSPCEQSPPGAQTNLSSSMVEWRSNQEIALADPGFVDMAGRDLDYLPGADMIEAGGYAAQTVSNVSNSVNIPVDNVLWFFDGYGIDGEEGDWIRFEGTTTRRQIVSINYNNDTLTVSSPVTVASGVGVHTDYEGNAPNTGHWRGESISTNRILTGWEPAGAKSTGQIGTILEYEDPSV